MRSCTTRKVYGGSDSKSRTDSNLTKLFLALFPNNDLLLPKSSGKAGEE